MPISTRTLLVVAIVLLVAVAVATVAAWWVLRQPPMTPVPIPSVSVG